MHISNVWWNNSCFEMMQAVLSMVKTIETTYFEVFLKIPINISRLRYRHVCYQPMCLFSFEKLDLLCYNSILSVSLVIT